MADPVNTEVDDDDDERKIRLYVFPYAVDDRKMGYVQVLRCKPYEKIPGILELTRGRKPNKSSGAFCNKYLWVIATSRLIPIDLSLTREDIQYKDNVRKSQQRVAKKRFTKTTFTKKEA
jgi:hypothetical protein